MERESSSGTPVKVGFRKLMPLCWCECRSPCDTDKRSDDGNLLTVLTELLTVLWSELTLWEDR